MDSRGGSSWINRSPLCHQLRNFIVGIIFNLWKKTSYLQVKSIDWVLKYLLTHWEAFRFVNQMHQSTRNGLTFHRISSFFSILLFEDSRHYRILRHGSFAAPFPKWPQKWFYLLTIHRWRLKECPIYYLQDFLLLWWRKFDSSIQWVPKKVSKDSSRRNCQSIENQSRIFWRKK